MIFLQPEQDSLHCLHRRICCGSTLVARYLAAKAPGSFWVSHTEHASGKLCLVHFRHIVFPWHKSSSQQSVRRHTLLQHSQVTTSNLDCNRQDAHVAPPASKCSSRFGSLHFWHSRTESSDVSAGSVSVYWQATHNRQLPFAMQLSYIDCVLQLSAPNPCYVPFASPELSGASSSGTRAPRQS